MNNDENHNNINKSFNKYQQAFSKMAISIDNFIKVIKC